MKMRLAKNEDSGFLFNSYLKSLKPTRPAIPAKTFFKFEHARLQWLLQTGITVVMVEDDDDDHIIGWCNAVVTPDKLVISYVYTKHAFRGNGFARDLINATVENYPHKTVEYCIYTAAGQKLIDRYKLSFNPYLFDITNFIGENKDGNC